MLDQRKMYIENNNLVKDLVSFEKTIKQVNVESPLIIQFSKDGKSVQFVYKDLILNSHVNRPLIHQLGSRAWGKNLEFKIINEIWNEKQSNQEMLEQELSTVFREHDLSIRYFTDAKGKNIIYGIVTPRFIDVDQLEFRNKFMEQTRQITTLTPESKGIEIGKFGEVIEYFKFDNPGFQTEFQYGLVYARNNGYEAYKVNWGRLIIICTNGLKRWEGSKFSWKHTKEVDLGKFINKTVDDGIANQRKLEEKITESRETPLNQNTIKALMNRMSLARASKERVMARIGFESNEVGYNEWALSQSLTWLGTHEKSIQRRTKQQLTGLGTDILDHSLDHVLEEESSIYYDGSYGLVLPKGYRNSNIK